MMLSSKIIRLDALFIASFGALHFFVPFLLPPNFSNTSIFAYSVIPGSLTLATLSLVYYLTKNRYPGFFLSFLYAGGVLFHAMYFFGVFPAILTIPEALLPFLSVGVVLDTLSILTIFDYYRRTH